ncbi:MAG: hypothetical protein QOF57_538 [Frankiaceae bacterium]|jgi:hypothetical protein|nr:hypothetical protein [Frankiaceae bacterium]MDQ1727599.1 hypothetical protein [Frankiaceae bacterium]
MPLFLGEGAIGMALLVLWIFCIIDVIRTPDVDTRNLPKLLWLLVVLIVPDVGSILWLLLGRPHGPAARREPRHGHMNSFPEYDRPGRFAATNPDDDAEFLAAIRERAEAQRKRAAEQRRVAEAQEAEERARRKRGGEPGL